MQKAVDNYKLASEKLTEESTPRRSLALDFLVAAYGPDKLADPTQAEPVVKRMIELAPNEPTNYFQLAKIYEDSGEYQLAEETYLRGRDAKPNDPTVYMTVGGYYNRQGDFEHVLVSGPILGLAGSNYDLDKLIYLGSTESGSPTAFVTRKEAGLDSLEKLRAAAGIRIGPIR